MKCKICSSLLWHWRRESLLSIRNLMIRESTIFDQLFITRECGHVFLNVIVHPLPNCSLALHKWQSRQPPSEPPKFSKTLVISSTVFFLFSGDIPSQTETWTIGITFFYPQVTFSVPNRLICSLTAKRTKNF